MTFEIDSHKGGSLLVGRQIFQFHWFNTDKYDIRKYLSFTIYIWPIGSTSRNITFEVRRSLLSEDPTFQFHWFNTDKYDIF